MQMKIKKLKKIKLRTGYVVAMLFFGIAFLESFRTKSWMGVSYWVAIGSLFLLLDSGKRTANYN